MTILDPNSVETAFTVSDLDDLDIGGVEARYQKNLASGSYKFLVKSAELAPRETEDGPVASCKLQFEVLEVVQLDNNKNEDGTEVNEADFVGATFNHTVWTIKTQKNLEFFTGLLTSILGQKPSGGLTQFLQLLVDGQTQFVGRLKTKPNKSDPESPYINLSEDPKHFQSFKDLSAQG